MHFSRLSRALVCRGVQAPSPHLDVYKTSNWSPHAHCPTQCSVVHAEASVGFQYANWTLLSSFKELIIASYYSEKKGKSPLCPLSFSHTGLLSAPHTHQVLFSLGAFALAVPLPQLLFLVTNSST